MTVIAVDDPADPRLADYRGLTDVALRRVLEPERGLYMAEGAKVIARALRAGHRPRSVLVSERWLDSVTPVVPDGTAVYLAPAALLEDVTGYQVHRGALASMERPELPALADLVRDARRVVVLEGLVDHTNVGAIFRSAAGIGADAVIVSPTCADPLYRRSVKVSMGTVFQVPWTRAESWPDALDELRGLGFTVAGLALRDDAAALDDFAARAGERVALLMGTEGDGLTRQALAHVDEAVVIPMHGGVDSLNVAAASAVAMWELRVR
ncbi:TrmH family RNA methyltransferase [Demequina mangrovi]|uniref:tRNA G18 (Ribose-2'-O)-methylase SpoU n=1 Tax=Demequina mangrovi TaxID=1043493 RepID=A0A1H7AVL8_9MICO|nr:RNA methyltransferase [Demequina mangrovi]SEJ69338.1 tRNA G18 (ribose-2'-O)-methylase SpoU [Demequina mangrovi]